MSQRAFRTKLFFEQFFRLVKSLFIATGAVHQPPKHTFDGGLGKQWNLLELSNPIDSRRAGTLPSIVPPRLAERRLSRLDSRVVVSHSKSSIAPIAVGDKLGCLSRRERTGLKTEFGQMFCDLGDRKPDLFFAMFARDKEP